MQYRRRQYTAEEVDEGDRLSRLNIRMELAGRLRETSVTSSSRSRARPSSSSSTRSRLTESESENALTLLVSLSTYFRTDGRAD